MTAALSVEGVCVRFGDATVLRDVDLALAPATVTGLIGPNGAGKTTLLDVISGFVTPSGGSVVLDGRSIAGLAPHRRAAAGLGRTFQSVELFDDMSITENLLVAAETAGTGVAGAARAADLVGLSLDDRRPAGAASYGERKRLALARALARRPRVLLLDEPAAGLDADDRVQLVGRLRDIAADDTTVLLVDHDLRLVLEACDRVVVLDFGAVIADGDPDSIRSDPAVTAAYVGRPVTRAATATATSTALADSSPALSARGLAAGYGGAAIVTDVDLDVARGEVVALLGPNGAGKTTTLLALSGALPDVSGDVRVLDRPLRGGAFHQARSGVAHVLQSQRVFADLTAAENLRLAGGHRADNDRVLDLLPQLRPVLRKRAGRLSGGEQQMLAVGRALVRRPRLLIIDELSLGLSPKVVSQLLEALSGLARDGGTAILVAEQHAELALAIASRAYVLAAGRVVDSAPAATFAADPTRLASAYLGGGT
jgi:branched-chain amino acid transport system ATP-binding protein